MDINSADNFRLSTSLPSSPCLSGRPLRSLSFDEVRNPSRPHESSATSAPLSGENARRLQSLPSGFDQEQDSIHSDYASEERPLPLSTSTSADAVSPVDEAVRTFAASPDQFLVSPIAQSSEAEETSMSQDFDLYEPGLLSSVDPAQASSSNDTPLVEEEFVPLPPYWRACPTTSHACSTTSRESRRFACTAIPQWEVYSSHHPLSSTFVDLPFRETEAPLGKLPSGYTGVISADGRVMYYHPANYLTSIDPRTQRCSPLIKKIWPEHASMSLLTPSISTSPDPRITSAEHSTHVAMPQTIQPLAVNLQSLSRDLPRLLTTDSEQDPDEAMLFLPFRPHSGPRSDRQTRDVRMPPLPSMIFRRNAEPLAQASTSSKPGDNALFNKSNYGLDDNDDKSSEQLHPSDEDPDNSEQLPESSDVSLVAIQSQVYEPFDKSVPLGKQPELGPENEGNVPQWEQDQEITRYMANLKQLARCCVWCGLLFMCDRKLCLRCRGQAEVLGPWQYYMLRRHFFDRVTMDTMLRALHAPILGTYTWEEILEQPYLGQVDWAKLDDE